MKIQKIFKYWKWRKIMKFYLEIRKRLWNFRMRNLRWLYNRWYSIFWHSSSFSKSIGFQKVDIKSIGNFWSTLLVSRNKVHRKQSSLHWQDWLHFKISARSDLPTASGRPVSQPASQPAFVSVLRIFPSISLSMRLNDTTFRINPGKLVRLRLKSPSFAY